MGQDAKRREAWRKQFDLRNKQVEGDKFSQYIVYPTAMLENLGDSFSDLLWKLEAGFMQPQDWKAEADRLMTNAGYAVGLIEEYLRQEVIE